MFVYEFDDICDGESGRGFVAFEFGRKCLLERGKCLRTCEAVEAEINLEIHRRMDCFRVFGILADRGKHSFCCAGFEQLAVFCGQLPRLCLLRLGRENARLHLFLKLKSLDFVGSGARQRLGANDVIANTLVLRQFATEAVEFVTNSFLRIGDLCLFEIVEIGDDNRSKFLGTSSSFSLILDADDGEFGHERAF